MDSMNDMNSMGGMDNAGNSGNLGNMGGKDGTNGSGNMGNGQHMYMHNAFWLPDRVSLTLQITFPQGTSAIDNVFGVLRQELANVNTQLHQEAATNPILNGVMLHMFEEEVPDAAQAAPVETFIFVPPSAPNTAQVVSFLEIKHPGPRLMDTAGGIVPVITNMLNNANRHVDDVTNAPTADTTELQAQVKVLGVSPAWFVGTTQGSDGPKTTGCPLSPPVPVSAGLSCPDAPGRYPITLPDLPHDLQAVTGDGVTVIVLDTMPKGRELARAIDATEEHNLLMLDVVNNMTINTFRIIDGTDVPGPTQPETGKDIYGRLIGFRMPDHGLFVSGIIRDLAPDANLESYRVLNDFCSGSVHSLVKALWMIYNRMLPPRGDLFGKPVVINLSLVIPDDMDVTDPKVGIDPTTLAQTRQSLLAPIQSLIDVGAIFVASAGNEGDQRYNPMSTDRPNALYPAQFVYNGLTPERTHGMIPVGAVGSDGKPATYSCYPGPNGVATFGGSLPDLNTDVGKNSQGMTTVNIRDGVIGLYSSLNYPALALEDPESEYPAPNSRGWAYWIGTSFATPIVSALAARALELRMRNPSSSHLQPPNIVSGGVTGKVTWDHLGKDTIPSVLGTSVQGGMIHAVQCKGTEHHHHHGHHAHSEDEHEEVEVNVTNVYLVETDADKMLES